jgi:hypothetical protein
MVWFRPGGKGSHRRQRCRRSFAGGAAYRLDVQHFMRTLGITTPEELRQADHKAVIAWERYMRETEHAAASTIRRCATWPAGHRNRRRARRRLAALSSLYKYLVRHDHAPRNPVGEVERPALNRDEGPTLAFSKPQARTTRRANPVCRHCRQQGEIAIDWQDRNQRRHSVGPVS